MFLYLVWQAPTGSDESFAYPLICALLAACLSVRCLLRKESGGWQIAGSQYRMPALIFAVMIGYWLALPVFGFLPASAALVIALTLPCAPRPRRLLVLFVGLSLAVMIWALFDLGLDASLPSGTLFH